MWSTLRRFLEVKRRRVLSSARKGIKIAIIVQKMTIFVIGSRLKWQKMTFYGTWVVTSHDG